ncbi:TPA: hypothetical protein JTC92_004430 [Escherichia coli]|nr:hypothetical protein [Escherichia coli]
MIKLLWIFAIMPLAIFFVLAFSVLILALALCFISMDSSVFFSLYEEATQASLTGIRLLYVAAVAISAVIILTEESDL